MKLLAGLVGAAFVASVVGQGCSAKHCSSNAECGSGEMCLYPIGDCSASGECHTVSDRPQQGCSTLTCSGNVSEYCGCNAAMVYNSCGMPAGYASGPTKGADDLSCFNVDAGPPGVDASVAEAASDAAAEGEAQAAPACAIPPEADASVGDAGGSCSPQPSACSAGDYGLMCTSGAASSIPTPAPSLQCSPLTIPTPQGVLFYCCPCGD